MSLRVLFMGTPAFAIPSLEALLGSTHLLVGVVTQPPRPAGRGRRPRPSPVEELARKAGLTVLEPHRVDDPEFLEHVKSLCPDAAVVVAYGQILPSAVLEIPPLGCLNVHPSLLPRHRGAAPIPWAILAGDDLTGVSVIRMDLGLDTGPVLASLSTPIGPEEDARELSARLSVLGAKLLVETLDGLSKGVVVAKPQEEQAATYAPRLRKEDGLIDWGQPAERIWRQVRALVPWPTAHTTFRGKQVKILKARPVPMEARETPGRIVRALGGSLWVATGRGLLEILELQPEGKPPMSAEAFIRGRRGLEGEALGGAPGLPGR
ncbi:MAG: methionyl-tRNA formyltransferase [Thermodesulfobacteriota bacterium]